MDKCTAINRDVYKEGSQILVMATQNQYLWEYMRDDNGSEMARRRVELMRSNVANTVDIVNAKYPGVGNITWDDFTDCTSAIPIMDKNNDLVLDENGEPKYRKFTRDELSMLSYKPRPRYLSNVRPLRDTAVMKSLCQLVPIRYDVYTPPEIIVLCFILLIVFIVLLGVGVAVFVFGDDDSQNDSAMPNKF